MKSRLQVDIKPNHQPAVRHLMQKLGNVSGADAIGFLIETQMTAALARLEPDLKVPQLPTKTKNPVVNAYAEPQDVTPRRQPTKVGHTTPHDDASNALDALLSA